LIAAALIAKAPTSYGFGDPEPTEPFTRDSVMVDGGTGLDLIARLADTTLDALRDLNPHLLRLVTPPGARYAVRVPNDRSEIVALGYAAVPEAERLAIATHKVKRGETVATVAKRYGVTSEVIRSTNRSARGRRLASGTTLYIPVSNTIPVALMREPAPIANTKSTTRVHVVKRGETLGGIAQKYHVTVASLRSSNRLGKSSTIRVGQRLVVRRSTRA
jgi:membrane-bound lytic murein transglycosylase D